CSAAHCCAIANDKRLKCWGHGSVGRTGYGDALIRGDANGQMGDCLPYVNLGINRTAQTAITNGAASCVLLDNGKTRCFGHGLYGLLLTGGTTDIGDSATEIGDNFPYANIGTNRSIVQFTHSASMQSQLTNCALLDDGTVKCWGIGGTQGLGDNITRGISASTVGDCLPTVNFGIGRTAKLITGTSYYGTCVIMDTDQAKCWGINTRGRLGIGDTLARGGANLGPDGMGDNLPAINLGEAPY
ncbi:MAG: hypothetical protein AAB425_08795, partial [Bdellovibrionota bacterium]